MTARNAIVDFNVTLFNYHHKYSVFTHYEVGIGQFVETRFLKETWFLKYLIIIDKNAIFNNLLGSSKKIKYHIRLVLSFPRKHRIHRFLVYFLFASPLILLNNSIG
jgi:hypothetical protein